MVLDIQSKEVIDKISDELKVQPSLEIPRQLDDKIKLVYEVNPRRVCDIVESGVATSSTVTIFTTPTERDFFLTNAWIALDTSNGLGSDAELKIFVGGAEKTVLQAVCSFADGGTNNEQSPSTGHQSINFSVPIKIDKGSIITITEPGGNLAFSGIIGYTTDPL